MLIRTYTGVPKGKPELGILRDGRVICKGNLVSVVGVMRGMVGGVIW